MKVGSFKAGGLSIKVRDDYRLSVRGAHCAHAILQDFIEFTMQPPEPSKAAFNEMRSVIPIRLTTDARSVDSMEFGVLHGWTPPTPPESTHEAQAA